VGGTRDGLKSNLGRDTGRLPFTAAAVFRPFFVQMTFAHINSKRLQTGTPGWTLGVKGLRKLDT
jgi:hypothetical protein